MKIEGRAKEMREKLNASFWEGNINSIVLGQEPASETSRSLLLLLARK